MIGHLQVAFDDPEVEIRQQGGKDRMRDFGAVSLFFGFLQLFREDLAQAILENLHQLPVLVCPVDFPVLFHVFVDVPD